MPITGINIPFNLFELRGRFNGDGTTTRPSAYASTDALSIPTFGPYLVIAGLANNWYKELLVSGAYVTRHFDGSANHLPEGVHVSDVTFTSPTSDTDGSATAVISLDPGVIYSASGHRAGLLLVDRSTHEAVYMDYKANLTTEADSAGNIQSVTLTLPKAMILPEQLDAYVILDVFPVLHKTFR